MKINTIQLTFLILFISCISFAQNSELARGYYVKARESMSQDKYQEAINYIVKSRSELGASNPDLDFMELSARLKLNPIDKKIEALGNTFMQEATRDDDRRTKVSLMIIEHRDAITAEDNLREKLLVKANKNEPHDIRKFIEKYPNDDKTIGLKNKLNSIEINLVEKIKKSPSEKMFDDYEKFFPEGKFTKELAILFEKYDEDQEYKDLLGSNNLNERSDDLLDFLNDYPQSDHKEEIEMLLEKALLNNSQLYFEQDKFYNAKKEIQTYKTRYPNGENIDQIKKIESKIKKSEASAERKSNRHGIAYIGLSSDTDQVYGIQFGALRNDRVSTYWNLGGNENLFNLTFSPDETVESIPESVIDDLEVAIIQSSFGVHFKVAYPIWMYVGAGARYTEYSSEDVEDSPVVTTEDPKSILFFPEAGFNLKLGNFGYLTAGSKYLNKDFIFQFGIGFSMGKRG
ncbi:hypothetical protein [Nonlabens sp. Asnod3-A02]|uniref:hypothetical protein n=1 Tax=Nonlabens sp. Asnod3-A02 TaxID=3160579 RepID=UPI0038705F34